MSVEQRIESLEMKVTYQEDLLQSLNDTIVEQQRRLDRFAEEISALSTRLESLASAPPIVDEKPPHY